MKVRLARVPLVGLHSYYISNDASLRFFRSLCLDPTVNCFFPLVVFTYCTYSSLSFLSPYLSLWMSGTYHHTFGVFCVCVSLLARLSPQHLKKQSLNLVFKV